MILLLYVHFGVIFVRGVQKLLVKIYSVQGIQILKEDSLITGWTGGFAESNMANN